MKKITLVLMALVVGIVGQSNAQSPIDLNSLLAQLRSMDNSPLSVTDVIRANFDEAEQTILMDYFAQSATTTGGTESGADITALDLFISPGDFGTMPIIGPYVINVLGNIPDALFADDYDAGGGLCALDNTLQNLVTVNPLNGVVSITGPLTGILVGHTVSGLSWSHAIGTMFALTTDGAATQLYTVNTGTGALNPVGAGTGNPLGIWLAIDNDGNAFMADIGDDSLYSVDLSTGFSTLIGPLGIDIGFAQDVTFDHDDNVLYMAGLINGGGEANVYSVDTSTGATTLLGTAGGAELGMFSIDGVPPLGIEDNLADLINIYPNPATTHINVDFPASIEILDVALYDILGKNTGAVLVNGIIDVSNISRGVYILNVKTDQGTLSQKVIKR